jgi:hypothetical protein
MSVSGSRTPIVASSGAAAAFPDVAATTSILVDTFGPYNKTTNVPAGFTFSGSGNIYYLFTEGIDEFTYYYWVMFSGSAQTAVGSGASINLLANKWYMLDGLFNGEDSYFLSLDSTNTTVTQTSTTIPLLNWSPARTITNNP